MKEFEDIVGTTYVIILGVIAVFIFCRYWYFRKTKPSRTNIRTEKKPYRYFRYLSLVALPLFLLGLVHYIFTLQKGNLFAPFSAKLLLLALLTLLLITEIRYNLHLRAKRANRIFNLIFGVALLVLGLWLNKVYLDARQYPDPASSVTVDLPFKGKWIASGAGASGLTNHHDRIPSQKYAIDFIKFGANDRLFKNEGMANEDSYTFGAEILSPVNGKVVHVTDNLPDQKILERDKLAGNHIVIQFQDTLFVALAHLRQNSIKVKEGDRVRSGDILAAVGNSGNTDFPHLHIHIQNSGTYDMESTKTYPIRFREFKRMRHVFWQKESNGFLLSNDMVMNE